MSTFVLQQLSPKSLTHEQATQSLISLIDRLVQQHSKTHSLKYRYDMFLTLLFAVGLLTSFFYFHYTSWISQERDSGSLVEALILGLTVILNIWLNIRESILTNYEMSRRIQHHLNRIKLYGIEKQQELKFPTSLPTVPVARVVRNDIVRWVPCNLLAEQDLVLIGFGEAAPAKVRYLSKPGTLERNQILKPSFFQDQEESSDGLFYFIVQESPMQNIILSALNGHRPKTLISRQFMLLERWIWYYYIPFVLLGSLAINLLRLFLVVDAPVRSLMAVELLINLQVYSVLPILPLVFPLLMVVTRSYGNAHILTLFDELQQSTTEYTDTEGVDQFDSAPPPTKNVTLTWNAIIKRFLDQMIKIDANFLARTGGLVESLGNTTVLCAIDREGTIASTLPSLDQMLCFKDGEPVILDAQMHRSYPNGIRFEDTDWAQFKSVLKPVGLNALLSTDCGVRSGRQRNDLHFRREDIPMRSVLKPSRELCLCHVGREVGFTKQEVEKYTRKIALYSISTKHHSLSLPTVDYHYEIPSMSSFLFQDPVNNSFQVFSNGHVEMVLESCNDYWNGHELVPLNENVEKQIFEFQQNALLRDQEVVAFSYRPIQDPSTWHLIQSMQQAKPYYLEVVDQVVQSEKPPPPNIKIKKKNNRSRAISRLDSSFQFMDQQDFLRDFTKGQTWLGMASFTYQPKQNVLDVIEDLKLAGIRFCYFSAAPERESKAYADNLGLEIDWNCCIILSPDDGSGPGYTALHDMKAKLPRGVKTIRQHLKEVDDVPLHVSLFAECDTQSIKEMIQIFQEEGEVVLCIGSSLNDMNSECFSLADVSIAVDPFHMMRHNASLIGPVSPILASSAFTCIPCGLLLHFDTSIYSVTQIIGEARTLASNGRQVFSFYLGTQLSLSLLFLVSYLCMLPPPMTGYQLMFILWIILPLTSFSLIFTPRDGDVLSQMPVKNTDLVRDARRFTMYFIIRFGLVPIPVCVALTWTVLGHLTASLDAPLWHSWILTKQGQDSLLFTQCYVMFVFCVYMIVISSTFVYVRRPVWSHNPLTNRVWIVTSLGVLGVVIIFLAIFVAPIIGSMSLPWWIHCLAFLPLLLVIPVQELVKQHDLKDWEQFQKRSKLEFNTKLGMHSPL
ncbi:hypothetical protein EDD86DRAFT_194553 [Gorgonomyces haynaldii]|nr:hypothetical protein EDD86DRAFT_194553 [Gorgonomyces haynaldii]